MKQKIANLTIAIPYKRAGNVIIQEPVNFDLYREENLYSLIPCLSEDEIRIANLPPQLQFEMKDGEPVSLRGKRDGNLHVIQDAVKQLQEHKQVL
jgi:hypothetical protein